MASLSSAQKLFIVQQLACYTAPSEVSRLLKEEFRIEVKSNQIARYDPTTLAGSTLSPELRDAFTAARQAFVAQSERIAMAQKNWRLEQLEEMFRTAKKRGALKLAADLLKQGAMEAGGLFERPTEKGSEAQVNDLPEALETAVEKVYGT